MKDSCSDLKLHNHSLTGFLLSVPLLITKIYFPLLLQVPTSLHDTEEAVEKLNFVEETLFGMLNIMISLVFCSSTNNKNLFSTVTAGSDVPP